MPVYVYRAIDENGILVRCKVQEKSKQNLVKKLKANGLTPIEVRQTSLGRYENNRRNIKENNANDLMKIASEANEAKKRNRHSFSSSEKVSMFLNVQEKISTRDVIVFTENFYLLKKAGFNNVHALSTLVGSTENSSLKGIIEDVLAGVERGEYMYSTLEYYSDIFPYVYINLIRVGEMSGSLDESLKQAVKYLESSSTLSKKIKGILIPNLVQFVVLLVLMFVGSIYVVPIIQGVFDQVGSTEKLPSYTIAFSNFLTEVQHIWYIPTAIIAAIIGFLVFKIKTDTKSRYRWDYFKYKMPIFGKLIFAVDFSRFANAMLLNLKNGMRIQESMEVSKNVINNYVMLSMIEASINNIIIGESWIKPFEDSGLCETMITEMLKVGMQTDLAEIMEKLVEYMEKDIDNLLQKIVKTLPQVLYSIIGVMIIFVTIVVLVPCIQLYMGNFLFSAAGV